MWEETRPKVWHFMENSEEINLMRVRYTSLSSLPPPGHLMSFPCANFIFNVFFFQTQTLLRNNVTANFFSDKLAGTQWSVGDVVSFLSKHSEDTRPHGTAFTWRDVFNETDQAIMSISRFMEVWKYTFFSVLVSYAFPRKHSFSTAVLSDTSKDSWNKTMLNVTKNCTAFPKRIKNNIFMSLRMFTSIKNIIMNL